MTSILTNVRALTALRTLGTVGESLDTANRRVSTGARIGSAADGAAYWAIATALKSDNGALGALKDAIGLDKTAIDAVQLGLAKTVEQLAIMAKSLVAAQSEQTDRAKLQQDIGVAQRALRSIAESTASNGTNWLAVQSDAAGFSATKRLVQAYSRQNGSADVSSTTLDTSQFILFDAKHREASPDWVGASDATPTGTLATTTAGIAAAASVPAGQGYTLSVVPGPGHNHVNGLLDTGYRIDGLPMTAAFSIETLDITGPSVDRFTIDAYLKVVDATAQKIQAGAALLGATATLMTNQQAFAQQLLDINASAIGTLVDADIEAESTRLKALQSQQQLGMQSLSIANAGPSAVLSLFN